MQTLLPAQFADAPTRGLQAPPAFHAALVSFAAAQFQTWTFPVEAPGDQGALGPPVRQWSFHSSLNSPLYSHVCSNFVPRACVVLCRESLSSNPRAMLFCNFSNTPPLISGDVRAFLKPCFYIQNKVFLIFVWLFELLLTQNGYGWFGLRACGSSRNWLPHAFCKLSASRVNEPDEFKVRHFGYRNCWHGLTRSQQRTQDHPHQFRSCEQ